MFKKTGMLVLCHFILSYQFNLSGELLLSKDIDSEGTPICADTKVQKCRMLLVEFVQHGGFLFWQPVRYLEEIILDAEVLKELPMRRFVRAWCECCRCLYKQSGQKYKHNKSRQFIIRNLGVNIYADKEENYISYFIYYHWPCRCMK